MHALVQEMVHFRNGCRQPHGPDPEIVSGFEKRYREILETARKEYENILANDYYKDRVQFIPENGEIHAQPSVVPA